MYVFHFSQVICHVYIKRRANLINKLQQRFKPFRLYAKGAIKNRFKDQRPVFLRSNLTDNGTQFR